nr:hypothetical protein [uncultured Desulfobulbus sp.]
MNGKTQKKMLKAQVFGNTKRGGLQNHGATNQCSIGSVIPMARANFLRVALRVLTHI